MSLLLGAKWTPECPNPSIPRESNVKHRTTHCTKLSTIVNTITTSSLRMELEKSHCHFLYHPRGNQRDTTSHRYILTEYKGNRWSHIVASSVILEGTNDVKWIYKHQHSLSARETSSMIPSISWKSSNFPQTSGFVSTSTTYSSVGTYSNATTHLYTISQT